MKRTVIAIVAALWAWPAPASAQEWSPAQQQVIDQVKRCASFAKGGRAILDADRNLCRGRHVKTLRQAFRRRGIGPVE